MKQPGVWKLSMGKKDFTDILEVLDWLRKGQVLAHSQTKKKAFANESQGAHFVHPERDGDYFYPCNGNRTRSLPRRGIILLGRFTGDSFPVRHHRWTDDDGWVTRRFEWIRTAISRKKFTGEHKQWTPRNNRTFIRVPDADLKHFESEILSPYFGITLAELGFTRLPTC